MDDINYVYRRTSTYYIYVSTIYSKILRSYVVSISD